MCCSILQCVAVCCIVLQCVAVCCSVMQCAAVCCSVLHSVAVCCSVSVRKSEEGSFLDAYLQYYIYGVTTISRLPKNIGLFCKRALQKRLYSAKETCTFKELTNRSHPICKTLQQAAKHCNTLQPCGCIPARLCMCNTLQQT